MDDYDRALMPQDHTNYSAAYATTPEQETAETAPTCETFPDAEHVDLFVVVRHYFDCDDDYTRVEIGYAVSRELAEEHATQVATRNLQTLSPWNPPSPRNKAELARAAAVPAIDMDGPRERTEHYGIELRQLLTG